MAAKTANFGIQPVTVTTAGTAVPIMTASDPKRFVVDFEIYVPSGNTGTNIYIGNSDVDNTWIPRDKGSTINFISGNGELNKDIGFDLSKIFIDADTSGDTVIVQYKTLVF